MESSISYPDRHIVEVREHEGKHIDIQSDRKHP